MGIVFDAVRVAKPGGRSTNPQAACLLVTTNARNGDVQKANIGVEAFHPGQGYLGPSSESSSNWCTTGAIACVVSITRKANGEKIAIVSDLRRA